MSFYKVVLAMLLCPEKMLRYLSGCFSTFCDERTQLTFGPSLQRFRARGHTEVGMFFSQFFHFHVFSDTSVTSKSVLQRTF